MTQCEASSSNRREQESDHDDSTQASAGILADVALAETALGSVAQELKSPALPPPRPKLTRTLRLPERQFVTFAQTVGYPRA
jgi:hypothetical protein